MIEFYSPTCPYCQNFLSEWKEAGSQLKLLKEKIPLGVANIKEVSNEALLTKYEIRGTPTIYWFKKGQDPKQYAGERKAHIIV